MHFLDFVQSVFLFTQTSAMFLTWWSCAACECCVFFTVCGAVFVSTISLNCMQYRFRSGRFILQRTRASLKLQSTQVRPIVQTLFCMSNSNSNLQLFPKSSSWQEKLWQEKVSGNAQPNITYLEIKLFSKTYFWCKTCSLVRVWTFGDKIS